MPVSIGMGVDGRMVASGSKRGAHWIGKIAIGGVCDKKLGKVGRDGGCGAS